MIETGFMEGDFCLFACLLSELGGFIYFPCNLSAVVLRGVHRVSFAVGSSIKDQELRSPCMLPKVSDGHRLGYVRGWPVPISSALMEDEVAE